MFGIIGIVLTVAMVFGGYILAGGKMGVITHSLPFEMMMIGGAAVGSFLLSNSSDVLKHTPKGLIRAFKGPKWHDEHHRQVLCLLFELLRLWRSNPVELEEHIETPETSKIFATYPAILAETSLHDTRVLFVEPAKWVAKLRATVEDSSDILLRTRMSAGHGGVSGRHNSWRERAFTLAWVVDRLTGGAAA